MLLHTSLELCMQFTLRCVLTHPLWTKWPPFHRRHLQMHLHELKVLYFIKLSNELFHGINSDYENTWYCRRRFIPTSPNFQRGPINNKSALVQVMAWWRIGNKPLSEPMLSSLTHMCGTRGRCVKIAPVFAIAFRVASLKNVAKWISMNF